MIWVKDIDSLYDFIGYVVLGAPNEFPVEDFLPPDEQMNLEKAFEELRRGLGVIDLEVANERKLRLSSLLDESLAAYRSGDDVKGAHLLQDFEALVFKKS